ncbi:hypothetical protein J6590_090907 [Homalodisca vitripennis]|nr:hypothetical protein J6590_090907 [Homalodisca vitripennis]
MQSVVTIHGPLGYGPSTLPFWSELAKIDRRSRKRAPPKLGAKQKKNNHMPLVGRDTKRDKISKEMNGSTTLRLDAGPIALAGRGHSIIQLFGQTRRTSPADGTHGDPIESQHNQ